MTIVETLVESLYYMHYVMECTRVFIRRLSYNVTVVRTMVEGLYDVCYVMEFRRVFCCCCCCCCCFESLILT